MRWNNYPSIMILCMAFTAAACGTAEEEYPCKLLEIQYLECINQNAEE